MVTSLILKLPQEHELWYDQKMVIMNKTFAVMDFRNSTPGIDTKAKHLI